MAKSFKRLTSTDNVCLLCENIFKPTEKSFPFKDQQAWNTLKKQCLLWSKVDIPVEDEKYLFRTIYEKIKNIDLPTGVAHGNCRAFARRKLEQYRKRYGELMKTEENAYTSASSASHESCKKVWRSTSNFLKVQRRCFICNETRASDGNPYNSGGLGRCCEDSSAKNLQDKMNCYLKLPNNRMHTAANRLHMILSGDAHDIYAADIYYHQSCYIKFALKPVASEKDMQSAEEYLISKNLVDEFFLKLERSILHQKSAYLLSDLMKGLLRMFEEQSIEPLFLSSKELKRKLIDRFSDKLHVRFFPAGRRVIVYSTYTSPCQYSLAMLKGFGLGDNDVLKAFGNMINRKPQ